MKSKWDIASHKEKCKWSIFEASYYKPICVSQISKKFFQFTFLFTLLYALYGLLTISRPHDINRPLRVAAHLCRTKDTAGLIFTTLTHIHLVFTVRRTTFILRLNNMATHGDSQLPSLVLHGVSFCQLMTAMRTANIEDILKILRATQHHSTYGISTRKKPMCQNKGRTVRHYQHTDVSRGGRIFLRKHSVVWLIETIWCSSQRQHVMPQIQPSVFKTVNPAHDNARIAPFTFMQVHVMAGWMQPSELILRWLKVLF